MFAKMESLSGLAVNGTQLNSTEPDSTSIAQYVGSTDTARADLRRQLVRSAQAEDAGPGPRPGNSVALGPAVHARSAVWPAGSPRAVAGRPTT